MYTLVNTPMLVPHATHKIGHVIIMIMTDRIEA